jgi:hypothetical protein
MISDSLLSIFALLVTNQISGSPSLYFVARIPASPHGTGEDVGIGLRLAVADTDAVAAGNSQFANRESSRFSHPEISHVSP